MLRHIDVYDPNSEYQAMMDLLVRALQLQNTKEIERLNAWFAMYHGDQNYANCRPIEADDTDEIADGQECLYDEQPDAIEQAYREGRISEGTGEIIP